MRTLILAGSFREASVYARARGLRHYRYAASATAVENFHAQRIVELPGFARRADRHALNGIAARLAGRGVERLRDEYVPEPVEETTLTKLASFTRADWAFAGCELSDDELRAVGATDDEIKLVKPTLTEEQETAVHLVNKGSGPARKTSPSATKRAPRKAAKSTPDLAAALRSSVDAAKKGSGNAAVPVAAESTDTPNTDSVDDLFED